MESIQRSRFDSKDPNVQRLRRPQSQGFDPRPQQRLKKAPKPVSQNQKCGCFSDISRWGSTTTQKNVPNIAHGGSSRSCVVSFRTRRLRKMGNTEERSKGRNVNKVWTPIINELASFLLFFSSVHYQRKEDSLT